MEGHGLVSKLTTWSLDSRKARREPGIMPLMPPPSMLSTVATLLLTKPVAISVSTFKRDGCSI
jgi:hypothetical protein